MSIKKYGLGGPIIAVKDKDGIETIEDKNMASEYTGKVAVCNKCGIQHLINGETKCACGNKIVLN
jgi:hypothetical protein